MESVLQEKVVLKTNLFHFSIVIFKSCYKIAISTLQRILTK